MTTYHFVDADGQEQGPRTVEDMLSLPEDTLVRKSDGPLRFMRLAQVPGWAAQHLAAAQVADGPSVTAPAHDADAPWYYEDDGGNERGPLATSQLLRLIRAGLVAGSREVRRGARGIPRDISTWDELTEALEDAAMQASHAAGADAVEGAGAVRPPPMKQVGRARLERRTSCEEPHNH